QSWNYYILRLWFQLLISPNKCCLTYLPLIGSHHKSPDVQLYCSNMLRAMYLAALLKRDTSSTLNGSAVSSVRAPRAIERRYGARRGPGISTTHAIVDLHAAQQIWIDLVAGLGLGWCGRRYSASIPI